MTELNKTEDVPGEERPVSPPPAQRDLFEDTDPPRGPRKHSTKSEFRVKRDKTPRKLVRFNVWMTAGQAEAFDRIASQGHCSRPGAVLALLDMHRRQAPLLTFEQWRAAIGLARELRVLNIGLADLNRRLFDADPGAEAAMRGRAGECVETAEGILEALREHVLDPMARFRKEAFVRFWSGGRSGDAGEEGLSDERP